MMSSQDPKPFEIVTGPEPVKPIDTHPANDAANPIAADPTPAIPRPSPHAEEAVDEVTVEEVRQLGSALAQQLTSGGYHPVVLFGTSASGKTSLLLSLFATLEDPQLEVGLALCDPILGTSSGIGRNLHKEAKHTFEVKKQAFLEGEPVPRTYVKLPFFIPVELRPTNKPWMRLAFLESDGEWYRPKREKGQPLLALETLYPELRDEIEDFIASFEKPITFIYLTPYTQLKGSDTQDAASDAHELREAGLAIKGVLETYDRIRLIGRAGDRHLMLVTKWDAHSARAIDREAALQDLDRDALNAFCAQHYGQAVQALKSIHVDGGQRHLDAYCAGIMNERGLLQLQPGTDLQAAVASYPIRLWTQLYRNALTAHGAEPVSPFVEPPPQSAITKAIKRLLNFVTGG